MKSVRYEKVRAFLFLSCSLLLLALPTAVLGQNLEIHHINVGQGTSLLIRGANGTTILFDGGRPGRGTGDVIPYLQSQGIMYCPHKSKTLLRVEVVRVHQAAFDEF